MASMALTPTRQQDGKSVANKLVIGGSVGIALILAILVPKLIPASRKLLREARKYVGIKEIKDNQGWNDAKFASKMKAIGWYPPAEWCNFFQKMLILDISKGKAKEYFQKNVSPATQTTWANMKNGSAYHKVLTKPEKGAWCIYQNISSPSKGHIEIVEKVFSDGSFQVISGNSPFDGSKEQGVARKKRAASGISGFRILGFIKITKLK